MADVRRFLLICHDRSGSNLLRSMLGQHPEIYVIPPLPIFEIIYYYQSIYGDLAVDENWQSLLQAVHDLYVVNHHPLPFAIDKEELTAEAVSAPRTLGGAVQCVVDLVAQKAMRPIIGLKFGAYHGMIDDFLSETTFDSAIFQYRDPRDVALSAWKAGVDERSPENFVRHWLDWHRSVRTLLQKHGLPHIEHRYEDLIRAPTATLAAIWDFIGVQPTDEALDFHQHQAQQEAAAVSYMWANIAKPLQQDNMNKFYAEWGPIRTRAIERALGKDALAEFGYRPANLLKFPIKSFLAKPERRLRTKEDRAFQEGQAAIAADIKERYLALKRADHGGG